MAFYSLEKKDISNLLANLLKEFSLIAPVKRNNITSFERIKEIEEVALNLRNTDRPPKAILFPQNEVIFSYREGRIEEKRIDSEAILFGVRACDVKGFGLLDRVFKDSSFEDTYYKDRRKNTLIFGLSCNKPETTCFCLSFKIGPFSKEGMDVFIVDLGERFLLESITEIGDEILNGQGLTKAPLEDIAKVDGLKSIAESGIQEGLDISGLKEKLSNLFDDPIWEELYLKCVGCGVCTFFCPTCHCFDIIDEGRESEGKRVRIWDSCMFPLFTLHASGHQPREVPYKRFRQRIMHKFNYYPERFKESACVGCGRCIINCPVNLDIRGVIHKINSIEFS